MDEEVKLMEKGQEEEEDDDEEEDRVEILEKEDR